MDKKIKATSTDLDTRKLKNSSSLLPEENQNGEVPIQWEIIQTEYDSGPKMGVD